MSRRNVLVEDAEYSRNKVWLVVTCTSVKHRGSVFNPIFQKDSAGKQMRGITDKKMNTSIYKISSEES